MSSEDWEARLAATWASIDGYDESTAGDFRAAIDDLVAELPDGSPIGPFERGSAFDSTGHSDRAVPLYQEALKLGLSGYRGRRAKIQLSSSLRNIGRPEDGVALLTPNSTRPPTSWTTPCAPRWRCACPAWAGTARACRSCSARWRPICPDTRGRWRITPACWSNRSRIRVTP